jgi:hypothetical protein
MQHEPNESEKQLCSAGSVAKVQTPTTPGKQTTLSQVTRTLNYEVRIAHATQVEETQEESDDPPGILGGGSNV